WAGPQPSRAGAGRPGGRPRALPGRGQARGAAGGGRGQAGASVGLNTPPWSWKVLVPAHAPIPRRRCVLVPAHAPIPATSQRRSGGLYPVGAGTLLARLDLEGNALATG